MPGSLVDGGDNDIVGLLRGLREHADYVIVDTAPVTIAAHASIIVDAGAVDRQVLDAAASQLHAV